MNVVGGYVVTDRMLQMFRKRPTAPKAGSEGAGRRPGRVVEERVDVPGRGSTPSSTSPGWSAAACFVLGLHLMNSPATARRGNRLSAGGMTVAVAGHARLAGRPRRRPQPSPAWVIIVVGVRRSAAAPGCTPPGP